MQQQHKDAIQKSFTSLVEQTDLDLMVTVLYEKGVFSEAMIEPYKDVHKDIRSRKRYLYREITRRGPDAFRHLLDALSENGYWNLVRELDPDNPLHPPPRPAPTHSGQGESKFLSLFDKRRTTGKEQNDPNRNREPQGNAPGQGRQGDKPPPENGNPEPPAPAQGPSGDSLDQTGIPHFNVIKSTRFFDDNGSDIKLYRTRGRRRGVLVLFSFISFKYNIEEFRHGARVDIDSMRYLFDELGFKVLSYLNLSLKETQETLQQLKAGMCGEGPETVFVVFSSHGYARTGTGDTDIRCSDGQLISYYKIIEYFNNENFPALIGIPKVFIFQTCRGSNKDHVYAPRHLPAPPARAARRPRPRPRPGRAAADGHRYDSDDSDDAEPRPQDADKTRDRMYSDILIAHSTVPGYASNRDEKKGSWYIQALCDVFAARAHDCHVEKLFTLVDMELRKRFATQTSSVDRWGFNRRLYLHPGLYED